MRFLRSKRDRLILPISLFGLALNISPVQATDLSQKDSSDLADVDLAKLQAGGKIVFVSSGARPTGFHAIDDERRTIFQFSDSDSRPTLIVELKNNRPVHRVSVVPGSQSQKVDVYLLNEWPHHLSDLDKIEPVTSIVDLMVGREAAVDFAPQRARYVALRWTLSANRSDPLKIAEVSAFTKPDSPQISDAFAASEPPPKLALGPPVLTPVSP